MLFDMAITVLAAFALYSLFEKIRFPGIIGIMLAGYLCKHLLGCFPTVWLEHANEIRTIALVLILLRAGLGLNRAAINRGGVRIISLGTLPAICECAVIAGIAAGLLGWSWLDGVLIGIILAAVSPAIVVPEMLRLGNRASQTKLPQILLAGASLDNLCVLALFSIGISLVAGTGAASIGASLILSILFGVGAGIAGGLLLTKFFTELAIRDTKKALIFLFIALLMMRLGDMPHLLPLTGMIAVMIMAFFLLERAPQVAHRIADKIAKIWIFAEIILFVLIGATINPAIISQAGLMTLVLIVAGVIARSIVVYLLFSGKEFGIGEKRLAVAAFLPKATVQAAIGMVPLALGMKSGELIFAAAVLAIIITAPLGAIMIKHFGNKIT